MRSLVSIIVPAFNAASHISDALESLSRQTFDDFDVVVVDDGSVDGTAGVVRRWHERSGERINLTLIRQENAGPSSARNRGIAAAEGKYIGFLDADDIWHPDKVAKQIAVMERDPAVILTCSQFRVIDQNGDDTGRVGGPKTSCITHRQLLKNNDIGSTSNIIVRASILELIGGFDESVRHCEDWDLYLRITALAGRKNSCVMEELLSYRNLPGQLTTDWRKMWQGWQYVVGKVDTDPAVLHETASHRWAIGHSYIGYLAYKAGDYSESRQFMVRAWSESLSVVLFNRRAALTSLALLAATLPVGMHEKLQMAAQGLRRRLLARSAR